MIGSEYTTTEIRFPTNRCVPTPFMHRTTLT